MMNTGECNHHQNSLRLNCSLNSEDSDTSPSEDEGDLAVPACRWSLQATGLPPKRSRGGRTPKLALANAVHVSSFRYLRVRLNLRAMRIELHQAAHEIFA